MRVAALYDIHANLPALDAVLDEVARASVDRIVIGGDVVPGPLPRETLARLRALAIPTHFIHGNGELAVLAQWDAADPDAVTYWGTPGGVPLPEPFREIIRWTARELDVAFGSVFRDWPRTTALRIDGVGAVLFCHATPHSETDVFTRLTSEAVLAPVFDGLGVDVVVCGHTHMQFDRRVGATRVVNAGSVGMPFGRVGADWLLLGPDVELRHTAYDVALASERIRTTAYPQAKATADQLLQPLPEAAMLDAFTNLSFR